MRIASGIFFLLVLANTACTDATAPALVPEVVQMRAAVAAVHSSTNEIVFVLNDAESRLSLSLPPGETTVTLRRALKSASLSIKEGDVNEAAASVQLARSALNALDPQGQNPDAVAIRLALGYAGSVTPALLVSARQPK